VEGEVGKGTISCLKVDGGASANDLLMQMQSDLSGIAVHRSSNPEATAAGAAYLAGLAVGFFSDRRELVSLMGEGCRFLPQMAEIDRRKQMDGWHRAVDACRVFAEGEK